VEKCRVKSWSCETIDKRIITDILEKIKYISKDKVIRHNKNRTVYRLKVCGKYYFVKMIHPKLLRHKIREIFWFNKSYLEYKSANFLKNVGLDVVKVVGWGKKGYRNFLVTEDAGSHITNARDFWLKTAKNNTYVRREFLNSFSYFLRKCIYANFRHPDFHLGNILLSITKDDMKFIFVDPAGVKFKTRKMDLVKQGIAELLISFIMKELSIEESVKLLLDSNIIRDRSEFDDIWLKLRKFNVTWVNGLWKKRRKRVLSKESRFSLREKDSQGNRWYLRKDYFGKVILSDETLDIDHLTKKYSYEILSYKGARQKWLLSYYMQFQSIAHVMPIVLYISHNKQESILLYEPYSADPPASILPQEIDRLKKLCKTAAIKVGSKSYEDCIVFKGGMPLLTGYSSTKKL
jgi:hypothetical protein